jgi:hypothetical protein
VTAVHPFGGRTRPPITVRESMTCAAGDDLAPSPRPTRTRARLDRREPLQFTSPPLAPAARCQLSGGWTVRARIDRIRSLPRFYAHFDREERFLKWPLAKESSH